MSENCHIFKLDCKLSKSVHPAAWWSHALRSRRSNWRSPKHGPDTTRLTPEWWKIRFTKHWGGGHFLPAWLRTQPPESASPSCCPEQFRAPNAGTATCGGEARCCPGNDEFHGAQQFLKWEWSSAQLLRQIGIRRCKYLGGNDAVSSCRCSSFVPWTLVKKSRNGVIEIEQ